MKILMVCLGNICRSPLAEGILRSKNKKNLITYIDSAGTAGYHTGSPPDKRAINIASKYDIDISELRARQFTKLDFKQFDIIYAMDKNNYNKLKTMANNVEEERKIKMILNEIEPNTHKSIPDPYYGEKERFQTVYRLLEEACEQIINRIG